MGDTKLLFVINSLGTGGAEQTLAQLLFRLPAHGIESVVATLRRRRDGVRDEVVAAGVPVEELEDNGWIGWLRGMRPILKRVQPDLIHTMLFEADVVGRLSAIGTGVPVLSSVVNTSYDKARLGDPNVRAASLLAVRLIDGWTARNFTTHFHAVSATVKASSVQHLKIAPEAITVVERGRDPYRLGKPSERRKAEARSRFGLTARDEVVVTVGRQEYQKGHAFLLRAVPALVAERPHLKLLVAGRRGRMSNDLEALCQTLDLGDRVRFLGHIDAVPELLAAADLFVFPSLFEGLGNALLEAMALGLPVVVSDIPVLREVVEEDRSGVFVPPAAPGELAAAVSGLLENRDKMRAFGERGREIFEERFTLDRYLGRMVDLYRGLVGR